MSLGRNLDFNLKKCRPLYLTLLVAQLYFPTHMMGQSMTINVKEMSLENVFKEIKKQTDFNVVCSSDILSQSQKITVGFKNTNLDDALALILDKNGLEYKVNNKSIVVTGFKKKLNTASNERASQSREIKGRVTSVSGEPLVGVSVKVEGTKLATITQRDGTFKILVPELKDISISFSSIGYSKQTIKYNGSQSLNIVLEEENTNLKELVVTGIYTRRKESFTGSSATYTQAELKQVGGTNIIQSLKTLDPAFNVLDNVQIGSDPNRLANLEIRGKSSMLGVRDNLAMDPNQPLFILDGFEASFAAINDLDINRIESITLLKDAASTAIYGSKAANGVVVVETIKPKAGKLQVSYNGNVNIAIPDLRSYNLMNASEKLQFELVSGRYDPNTRESPFYTKKDIEFTQLYNNRLKSIAEGIDSYWLAEPVATGINQKHSLYVMGGEGNFIFGLGGGFNGITGAMKQSKRSISNGNLDLIYRVANFQFSNKFTVSNTRFSNPIVPFGDYARANPYYRKRNNQGVAEQWLEYNDDLKVPNPLYDASLNSRNSGQNFLLSNYFVSEWMPSTSWRLRGRFGLTYDNNETENFTSPENSWQILNKPADRRGDFTYNNNRGNQYEGELTVSYSKLFNKHQLNLVGGGNINSRDSRMQGYAAEGFPVGNFTLPSFAKGYLNNSVPTYIEAVNRSVNGYFNLGYGFDNRYLMDVNLRSSGSSIFGSRRKYNTTWSVGLGWNIHREAFIAKNAHWINFLKLRGSIGNPGNQNFDSGKTFLTYQFTTDPINYFGLGLVPDLIGNPDLAWQITQDRNIGLDLAILKNRLTLNFDYFHKVTDPLLININTPLSSGTTYYYTNAGEQVSKGFMFAASYHILRNTDKRILWSVRVNGRGQTSRINNIGNSLDLFNKAGRGNNTRRYYDGADPDDIWVVPSYGIDPSTGKELFKAKDGRFTYDFSYENEAIVGNSRPQIEGVVGSSFTYRGFTFNLNMRYRYGAKVFNSALLNKVENIDFNINQDRRALYERWQNPGDIRPFKNIIDPNYTPLTSRFVQTENVLTLESIYAEYQFNDRWIKKFGLGNLKVFASVRDAARISNIRAERGLDYPFAIIIDGGLSFNF